MTSDREHAHAQAILDAIQKKVVEEYYSGPGNSLRATSDALHSDQSRTAIRQANFPPGPVEH